MTAYQMTQKTEYSKSWIGQDGNEWRHVHYCVGAGQYRTFLQVKRNGEWQGW
jgi:hypothetical protein